MKNFGNFLELFSTNFDFLWSRNHKTIAIIFSLDQEETLSEYYQSEWKCLKTFPNDWQKLQLSRQWLRRYLLITAANLYKISEVESRTHRLEAKAKYIQEIWGQGQEPTFLRAVLFEAKDRNAQGQGPKTQRASVLQKERPSRKKIANFLLSMAFFKMKKKKLHDLGPFLTNQKIVLDWEQCIFEDL